ncbi:MAG TPA: GTPase HflX [Candidatus Dormibacteraeota bacterium]|nr:GTPase HflX [Candidatus Dormibacteraeota bacterium]
MARPTVATDRGQQRALVVAVDLRDSRRPLEPELAEFEALARAVGVTICERIVQKRDAPDPATLIGSGLLAELPGRAAAQDANLLLVFNELRSRQRRNLEKALALPIVDRTMLILDVFARRARSHEGKLQVELAQLRYRQSKLAGTGSDLSRLGGGVGTRGPGETKLEVDRRKIAMRITLLEKRMSEVRRGRATRRHGESSELSVALVGYTNVGKSSLLNALARSDLFVADQPFATLDPTTRRVYLGPQEFARVSDTVGFITDLPNELLDAFRATLEELREADLLLEVIDASSADAPRQRAAVDAILHELELDGTPRLLVYNKCDARRDEVRIESDAFAVSARSGEGLDALRLALGKLSVRFANERAAGGRDRSSGNPAATP